MVENKKKIILLVVGVSTLLITVIGATFAYFNMVGENNSSTADISGTTGSLGTVVLETIDKNIFIDLGIDEMSSTNIGKTFYSSNDESIPYNEEITSHDILKTSVVGGDEGISYNCTYTLNIEGTGYESLNENDAFIVVDGEVIDLTELKNNNPITREIEVMNITNEVGHTLKGYAYMNNRETNQNNLRGLNLSLEITATELECTANFDTEAPIITTFIIGDDSGYTNTEELEIYFEYTDNDDTESYCISEESSSDNCIWENIEETTELKELNTNYMLNDANEENKIIYLYLKDEFGNISSSYKNLVLDKVTAEISNVKAKAYIVAYNATGGNTLTATLTDDEELGGYHITTNATYACGGEVPTEWTQISGTNYQLTTTLSTSGMHYIWIKDASGNSVCTTKQIYKVYYQAIPTSVCSISTYTVADSGGRITFSVTPSCTTSTDTSRASLDFRVIGNRNINYTLTGKTNRNYVDLHYDITGTNIAISSTNTTITAGDGILRWWVGTTYKANVYITQISSNGVTIYNGGFKEY